MPTHVSFEKAVNKFRALANVLHRPLRDVLDSGARVAAISLAKSTQPSRGEGTGRESQEMGETAVVRDIYRVYKTISKAYEDIADPRMQKAFWRHYKNGNIELAQSVLDQFGRTLRGVKIGEFTGGFAHIGARDSSTGRVGLKRPLLIVTNYEALEKYVETEKKKVGTAKGGWADVVRALGSNPRGLKTEGDISAIWITRHAKGYGKASKGGTDDKPTITITNSVPYMSDHLLSNSSRTYALKVAHDRMIKNLEIAVKEEVKNLSQAA